ncbi:hypothetical protein rosag_40580 [Roseisolibacter agri]|uniref:Uncharacterized protein n=1 Tax=Roseisolibacter agri TaxID=2014610 RepID=A0AA37Q6N9_9BACT|nr:hypothetical protein rosag_40580 [Roseisolibacter agri]
MATVATSVTRAAAVTPQIGTRSRAERLRRDVAAARAPRLEIQDMIGGEAWYRCVALLRAARCGARTAVWHARRRQTRFSSRA